MSMNFRIILSALIVFGISGCNTSWLDIKPSDKLSVPASLGDFQALLDNVVVMNTNSPALQEVASDGHYTTEAAFNWAQNPERNAYTWTHDWSYETVGDWNNPFEVVFQCNLILEGLDKMEQSTNPSTVFNNVKGQAMFQRARAFYELSQVWAPPYRAASSATDLGIPIRLTSDVNIPSVRATLRQTYDQILSDLMEAHSLLPLKPDFKHRGSKIAALALLARVYLSMEDYVNAEMYSEACLNITNELLDFNSLPVGSANPYPTDYENNPEVLFRSNLFYYNSNTYGTFIDRDLYDSYESEDLRRTAYYRVNADGTISFKMGYVQMNFNGLAVDELYLIRAECYARAGNKDAAMADLNTLMSKRWNADTWVAIEATDADDALFKILDERKKELVLRGLRWSDLRRLNNDPRFAVNLSRTIGGRTYTLEANSFRYTFPIPTNVIQLSGMQQNPGW